jgi:hypothetical protein
MRWQIILSSWKQKALKEQCDFVLVSSNDIQKDFEIVKRILKSKIKVSK